MIRVAILLVAIVVMALGAGLADRPGEVAISWLGWRIETSVAMLAIAVATVAALTVLAWSVLRAMRPPP